MLRIFWSAPPAPTPNAHELFPLTLYWNVSSNIKEVKKLFQLAILGVLTLSSCGKKSSHESTNQQSTSAAHEPIVEINETDSILPPEIFAKEHFKLLVDERYDELINNLDIGAFEGTSREEWMNHFVKKNARNGKLISYERILPVSAKMRETHTSFNLHYHCKWSKRTTFEKMAFVKRGESYHLSFVVAFPTLEELEQFNRGEHPYNR